MKRDEKAMRDMYEKAMRDMYEKAMHGDATAMSELKKELADELEKVGKTILCEVCIDGDTERVRFILREFADRNILIKPNSFDQTALSLAAGHGHTKVVEVLIEVATNFPWASSADNPITSFQAFVRQPDKKLNTALFYAARNGHVEAVKLLVKADPSDTHIPNEDGKTPIYMAVERGLKDILEVICTTCVAQSLEAPGGTTALHALIKEKRQAEKKDITMMGIIINAVKRWSTAEGASQNLLEAIFNITDESGRNVLDLAVERNNYDAAELILQEDPAYLRGCKKIGLMRLIFKLIDEHNKDLRELLSKTYQAGIDSRYKGVHDLILAIQRRDKESILSLLRDAKQLLSFAEEEGWTVLHYAAYHGFDSILDVLIKGQMDVGFPFEYKDRVLTPLLVAAERGFTSTIILLMELWPTTSSAYTAVNTIGRNILHIAAAGNKEEMIRGILKYCPENFKNEILKQKDDNDDTVLHLLISHGCFVPELINHKELDTTAKNKNNWTPQDMLYSRDDIIADQVQIKIAIDNVQTKRTKRFWPDISESTVHLEKREKKDAIFKEKTKLYIDEEQAKMELENKIYLETYKKRTNTQIIVTALITTVTFTVGFTMPGGLHQSGEVEEGLAVFSRKTAFKACMVSDAIALVLSTSSLIFYFLESMNENPHQVRKLNAASTGLNIVSVIAMMLTFITGTYAVLSDSPILAISVCVICSLFFLLIIALSVMIVYGRRNKTNKDE